MKAALLTAICFVAFASPAFAQGGWIAPSGSPGSQTIFMNDLAAPGLLSIYIVHWGAAGGATASQFSAPQTACMQMTYLSETPQFAVTIGNSQTGVAIGYGACLTGNIHALTVNYFTTATTGECCLYRVLPDPLSLSGQVEVVDCNNNLITAFGAYVWLNPDAHYCGELPVEETTWGRVKSLYSD